jgi:hypothetical protein
MLQLDDQVRVLVDVIRERLPGTRWVRPYSGEGDDAANQFVVFLKPEALATEEGVRVEEIMKLFWQALERWNVEIGAVRFLASDYLRRHEVMDQHYGVINAISRRGIDAISATARRVLEEAFSSDIQAGAEVLGGHQFRDRFPSFSPLALATISDNVGVKKLAGGTYCLRLKMQGKIYLILNAFHPFQLEYFTAEGKAIFVLEGRSATPWADLRQRLVGATDPAKAAEGSVRRTLLDRRAQLGLREVSSGVNGIHLSAGPLEGMVEVQRFFSEPEHGSRLPISRTLFGRLLARKGISEDRIELLARNPTLDDEGRSVPAFDFTEELDALPAAEKLARGTN